MPTGEYNIVLFGSQGTGKKSLVTRFVQQVFIEDVKSSSFAKQSRSMQVDGSTVFVSLSVPGPSSDVDSIIRQSQGFLLLFSLTDMSSAETVWRFRNRIVQIKGSPSVPMILVGTKSDLEDQRTVMDPTISKLKQQIGCELCALTSAKSGLGVEEVVHDLVKLFKTRGIEPAVEASPKKKKRNIFKIFNSGEDLDL